MSEVWVFGSAAWDLVYEIDQMPGSGGRATARSLGRRAGGSTANVARALGSAGHRVRLIAQVGTDGLGTELLDELGSWGIDTAAVLRYRACTPETMVFVDKSAERSIVVLEKDCAAVVPVPYSALADADGIFIGRYADFEPELPAFLRRKSPGLVLTAVPPPTATELDWFAHIVIGSRSEYPADWLAAPFDAVRRRVGDQLRWVIVTQGHLGATGYGPDVAVPIPAVEAAVADATGAGDSFAAGLMHGLLQARDLATAGRLGAYWAAAGLPLQQSVPATWAQLGLGPPTGDWAALLR